MSNNDELLKLENDIYLSNEGIYFAVYDNAFTKNFIEDKLIKRFKARNINVLIINSDNFQLGKTLIDKQKNIRTDTVFFSYPPLDMNKFIQYTENLNYTRDFFKNIKYPVIIWVSNEDLNLIIENAPDFWAWRSRVVSFRSKRDKRLFEFEKHEWKEKVSDELIDSIEKDLHRFEIQNDLFEVAKTSALLADLYFRTGKWDRSIQFYYKNLETFEKLGDVHGMAQTYNNLGLVYTDKGEWDKAIEFYEKSLETLEKVGDVNGMALTYGNLGSVYARKGEWDKAIEFYEKDLKISEKMGDVHGMAQTYGNLGIVYADKGEWDKAIEFYEKSLQTLEKVGDVHGMGGTYVNLGKLYLEKSELQQAKENLEKSIKLIHPDARPDYPNAMNWLAACERMLADVLKEKIKQTSDKKEKYMLMDEATSLYNKSSERYYTVSKLRLARMPRSINSDIHITKALAFSVQNLVIDDDKKAIKLLEEAIKEIQSAIPYSDGYNAIKLQGMLANHRAKSKIREAVLNKDKPKKHKKKIEEAIKFLEEATKTYQRLGDDGACSSSVCNGCVHLYRGLVLVGEYIETKNVDKEISAVKEFVEAKKCYEDSELGKESIGIIDKIISLSTRLARKETEDWDSIRTSVEELLKLSDDISFIGLKKMVKIYTFDKLEEDKEPEVDKKKEPIFIIDLYPLQI